jgi:hypothetical protein
VAVFVTDAPAKHRPKICSLSKLGKSPIFRFFHTDSPNTITNALTWAVQSVNKQNNIQCANWSSFSVANTNSIPQFLS